MSSEFVIVTRHSGVIEWLARHGISGQVIAHVADPAQVAPPTPLTASTAAAL